MSILESEEYKTPPCSLIITVAVCPLTLTHKMKAFIILALVAVASADVSHLGHHAAGPDADAVIVSQNADVRPDGYQQQYQTSNGISGQEEGVLKNVGREDESISVQGSNQYTAPDGQNVQISYVADENGYQPQGAHLPTPPPVPEAIARALKYIAEHPQPAEPLRKF